jgi:hypothetical protein
MAECEKLPLVESRFGSHRVTQKRFGLGFGLILVTPSLESLPIQSIAPTTKLFGAQIAL